MTIKPATTQDTASIAKLILLAIHDIANQLTGETLEADVLKQLETFLESEGNRFSRSCVLVTKVGNQTAGMILCYHGKDADRLYQPVIEHLRQLNGDPSVTIDQEADEDEYYIDALAVDPLYQGKGLAKQLIKAAERSAREMGCDKIALNVDQENEAAHALYRKLGYQTDKVISIHHKPYWHMIKLLP